MCMCWGRKKTGVLDWVRDWRPRIDPRLASQTGVPDRRPRLASKTSVPEWIPDWIPDWRPRMDPRLASHTGVPYRRPIPASQTSIPDWRPRLASQTGVLCRQASPILQLTGGCRETFNSMENKSTINHFAIFGHGVY